MKIKTWLLLTYLLIMLLPLVGAYALYLSINAYYQDRNIGESVEKRIELNQLKKVLEDPSLYQMNASLEKVMDVASEQVQITLYSPKGYIYYSSNPFLFKGSMFESKEQLLKDLYEFKQNYQTFVYKEPVYHRNEMVGIYEVTLLRTEWMEQVNHRSYTVGMGLLGFLIIIYGIAVYFLNRRLNRPVKELISQMRAYAKGEMVESGLHRKKDELGELAWSFKTMQMEIEHAKSQLEEEQRQKEFMIASLSHDLKTPLTSIQAYAEGLGNSEMTETEQKEYVQIISSKADYMKHMLDDLMMYTLLQSPTYELKRVTVEGAEFFDMLLADYDQVCKEKGFTVETFLHVEGTYDVHPKQLIRVIDNLMSNAWTYTEQGGFIGLAAFELPHVPAWCKDFAKAAFTEAEGVYLVVQNSGEGISLEECNKLFNPLYQVDQSRSKAGHRGAGLGLSIAKQIIEKHQGHITVCSEIKKGTAIICWLPTRRESE
ncbi:MAG: sensor histidine kinase [Lysinibacillus sp.]